MKTIMQDIARIAGVSPGTVSNALNNRKGVGKETRERIIQIAEELGYNHSSGSDEDSKIVRLIIFKKNGYIVSDTPFFSALIEGIEGECRNQGYEILISHIIYNEHNRDQITEIIKQEQLAGVLILATEMDEQDLLLFNRLSIPVVLLDSYFKKENYDCVLINNNRGAYEATSYLINNGHTKIGCLGSSIQINNFEYRKAGFVEALADNSLQEHKEYNYLLEPTLEGAYRDMKEILMNKKKSLPTAFFAFNDILALGAIRAMNERGIKIPEEVSVIGFDDMPFCEISNPRLTTIKVYKQEIGRNAVKRLIQKIEQGDSVPLKIEVNTQLVERDSVRQL